MNTLIAIRANELFAKDMKEEMQKFTELIFICDKAGYQVSNEGEVIRHRETEQFRVIVSDNNMDALISQLVKLRKK